MQRTLAHIASLPLTLLLAASAVAQDVTTAKPAQKHMVRFSFKQGAVRHSVLDMDMNMSMNMGAQDIETKVKTTMWTSTSVKAINGNTADIVQKITRVKAKSDSLVMKVNYDSDDEDSDPGAMEGLDELVGESTTLKLTDQGKVSDVKVPEAANDMQASGVNLNEILKSTVTQLPAHPIAIGDTWKVDQEVPLGANGTANGVIHYKLLAIDKTSITLEQKLVIDTENVQAVGMKGMKMSAKGTSKLDLMTGSPIEMDVTTRMEMDAGMSIKMVMRQRITPAAAPKKKPTKPQEANKAEPVKIGK